MNIGDRVRAKRSSEEGIVVRFVNQNLVEVEIEDGFRLEYPQSDLVVVAREEKFFFGEKQQGAAKATDKSVAKGGPVKELPKAEKGVYLAFVHQNDKVLEGFVINNTDFDLLFTFGQEDLNAMEGLAFGHLPARSTRRVHQLNLDKAEHWPAMVIQIMLYRYGLMALREPHTRRLRLKGSVMYRHAGIVPVLGQDGYVFQLDEDLKASKPITVEPEKLAEAMQTPKSEVSVKQVVKTIVPPARSEVDLHAEALGLEVGPRTLEEQLKVFERELDAAVVTGAADITFIHGVGNGILKTEIHRRLSKNSHIQYYQEAKKEKFGYGATYVKLK